MNTQNVTIGTISGSAFDTVKNSATWLGHKVVNLTKLGLEACKKGVELIIFTLKLIWSGIKPVFSTTFSVIKSPAGIATALAGIAALCIKKANECDECTTKVAFSALGMGSAFLAGIVAGAAYL